MGWFSPVKGSYPSLAQVDKTLPVKEGVKAIERGTIVALTADDTGKSKDGVWNVGNGTDTLFYVALQDYTDPTAGFAGSAFNPAGGVPAITALDLAQDGEFETSVFKTDETFNVGDPLYVNAGVLTKTNPGSGKVVGYVTRGAVERWVNNAVAVKNPDGSNDPRLAVRTGANLTVLRFKTAV